MKQVPTFVNVNHPNHECKLLRFLYGLKEIPRDRFDKLDATILEYGFIKSRIDDYLFWITTDLRLYVLIYVDDIIITRIMIIKFDGLLAY